MRGETVSAAKRGRGKKAVIFSPARQRLIASSLNFSV
jgi:hypothetical protein